MESTEYSNVTSFDETRFTRALGGYCLVFSLVLVSATLFMDSVLHAAHGFESPTIFGIPLLSVASFSEATPLVGDFATGGVAMGIVAVGGAAMGVLALGGGALGVVAIGGGAVGIVAIGGGTVGIVALGGGACGIFAMGGGARGQHRLDAQHQDPEAIRFFCRWLPGLRSAFPDRV